MGLGASPKGVIVLYNENLDLILGEPHDYLAENGVIACASAVEEALSQQYPVIKVPIHTDIEPALAPYPPTEWVVFNLGEGIEGRLFEEARIAWALEAMGYTFTGSSGEAIAASTNKATTKQRLARAGVQTPSSWLFRDASEIRGEFEFPLIVKPVAEDASLGIEQQAVVHDLPALRERVIFVNDSYRQSALVESFIQGREFNTSLWGEPPEVLPLYEIDFSEFPNPFERIVSFAAKWESDTFEYNHTPGICPAQVGPQLARHISLTALHAWRTIGCRGYARVDMRLDTNDKLYVIEVNCNPDLSPDAGFYGACRVAGYNYSEMILKILRMALVE
ncbi:MAG: D-alanine--D-alanine ligase [Chloroflexota bacterium]